MGREEKEKRINEEKEECWWKDPKTVERLKEINKSLCKIHREEFKEYL